MLTCPDCKIELSKESSNIGMRSVCESCDGQYLSVDVLRESVESAVVNELWQAARNGAVAGDRSCPACVKNMMLVSLEDEEAQSTFEIDVCTNCQAFWIDPTEFESLCTIHPNRTPEKEMSKEERLEVGRALVGLEVEKHQAAKEARTPYGEHIGVGKAAPDTMWKIIPAALGFPIRLESDSPQNKPWVMWILVLLMALGIPPMALNFQQAVWQMGFIPAEPFRNAGLTIFTSCFLHAHPMHFIGNLYALLMFAPLVEDVLGQKRFACLLVVSQIVACVGAVILQANDTLPGVGASGVIFAVMVFYALQFPGKRISIFAVAKWRAGWIHLPSALFIFALMLWNIAGVTWMQGEGFSPVSYGAHLGGAVVGWVFWKVFRRRKV